MAFQKPFQGKIGHDIAIINPYRLVTGQEILNIFKSASRIQKDGFMAKDDGPSSPLPIGEGFVIAMGLVMRIDDKPFDTGCQEMVHGIGHHGTPPHREKGFGAGLRQGPHTAPQTGAQDKSRFDCLIDVRHRFPLSHNNERLKAEDRRQFYYHKD
jgi:hypothetical protein